MYPIIEKPEKKPFAPCIPPDIIILNAEFRVPGQSSLSRSNVIKARLFCKDKLSSEELKNKLWFHLYFCVLVTRYMNPWSMTLSYILLLEYAVLLIYNFVNQLVNESMNLDVRTLTLTLRINFFSDIRQTYLPHVRS